MNYNAEPNQNLLGAGGGGLIIGIIAKEETWCKNEERKKWTSPEAIKGFGQRYKVRIVGKHDKKEIPDEELPWAKVILPPTAGSGHANSSQSAIIKEGTWVTLLAKDGKEGTEYFINGILPNDSQNEKLPEADDNNGFKNKTGFGDNAYRSSDGRPVFGLTSSNKPTETNSGSDNVEKLKVDDDQEKDGTKQRPLPVKRKCGGDEINAIQLFIQDIIQQLQEAMKFLKGLPSSVQVTDINSYKQELCEKVVNYIAGKIKNLLEEIRKRTLDKIQEDTKKEYGKVWEEDQPKLRKVQEEVWELISCLFNLFIDQLKDIIKALVCPLLTKAVNFPKCAAVDVGSDIIKKIIGPILDAINAALVPLYALLGLVPNLGLDIMAYLAELSGFFGCDVKPECETLLTWSFWDGAGSKSGMQVNIDIPAIFGGAGGPQGPKSNCKDKKKALGPKGCGPPSVEFTTGGAAGNAIVSSSGDLLAIDVVNSGSPSQSPPNVIVADECRSGSGVETQVITNPNGTVNQVVVLFPGDGYLPAPNGSKGGDGRTWATPDQTIVQRANDDWDLPYSPGEEITLNLGDTITLPENSFVDYPIQLIGSVPYTVELPISPGVGVVFTDPADTELKPPLTIIAPAPVDPEDLPKKSNADTYGVILTICNPFIVSPGIGYSPDDEIIIEPNNGTELQPVFNENGSLIDIEVVNPGNGYDFWPTIYVKSTTGFNAKIVPNFCVNRVEDVKQIPEGETIIRVVDCVGKLIPDN